MVTEKQSDFTIKRIIIRHRAYIAVWSKGRKGLFALFRQKKGITKKKVERTIQKKFISQKEQEEQQQLFRITTTLIYFYDDGKTRVGRLRLVLFTRNKAFFSDKVMNKLLRAGNQRVQKINVVKNLAKGQQRMAIERKRVDVDEFKRSGQQLEAVMGELAGFGMRSRKFRVN